MDYTAGSPGRVFVMRVDHGEDLLAALTGLAGAEGVETGVVLVLGALADGRMSEGPTTRTLPPVPVLSAFEDGRELLGAGLLLREEERPVLHLHGAVGRAGAVSVGCLRERARVYATVEVILFELLLGARRCADPVSGFSRVEFGG
ncbi:MAG TPA: DUF296 domain-containing protein [Methanoregulaceae archaeon]|nr:DUF296 domain-containing protein [Methanoregulaceae archaeon]HQJ88098.1 DUF296 domain-containing protein [Methanoregulaceae archaeon]